jgi:hypothetical protein
VLEFRKRFMEASSWPLERVPHLRDRHREGGCSVQSAIIHDGKAVKLIPLNHQETRRAS